MSLLNPSRFDWAKSFLSSIAWNLILKDKESEAFVAFSIPNKCPANEKITCVSEELIKRTELQEEGVRELCCLLLRHVTPLSHMV
jgi:hypothetical protein